MALIKEIIQEDGVATTYHRILYIQSTVNSHISIAVLSYIDKSNRERENENSALYKRGITFETEYVENMSIEQAYELLKTKEEFFGAVDDI